MSNTIQKLYKQGQSIWCDNISRQMIDSGELQRLIDLGVTGVTSNPTIFMKAVTQSTDYDARLSRLAEQGHDTSGLYENLVLPDIVDAADLLRPIYDRTNGVDGYVSLEVSPRLAYDTARLFDCMHPAAIGSALAFIIYERDLQSLILLLPAIIGLLTIVKALVYVYLEELEFKSFGKEFRRAYYGREVTVTVVTADDNDGTGEGGEPLPR